jgi:phosphopantothenoylcysteine decarboxylase / phosphopantothenate---cysteine ligase
VADYRPSDPRPDKIKKAQAGDVLALQLERTEDVLTALASRRRPGQVLVGFAAETGPDALSHAREKRARKRLDAVVLNDVSRPDIGFDTPDNEVTVVTANGETRLPRAPKREIARLVLAAVLSRASSSAINVVTESHGAA